MFRSLALAFLLLFRLAGCEPPPSGRSDDAGAPPIELTDAGPAPAPDADPSETCAPSCDGLACGDNGCGGTCGTCAGGELCEAGLCVVWCPSNASRVGDECACDPGYLPDVGCTYCERDSNRDGCPANAAPGVGGCECEPGYEFVGCGCAETEAPPAPPEPACAAGETTCGGGCIPDTDNNGCPDHGRSHGFGMGCYCNTGYAMAADGCACEPLPSYEDPAFEATSCAGAPMAHEDAEDRWRVDGTLGSYQMKFRRRYCDDLGCGPWVEVPLSEISWRTRASGLVELQRRSGVMNVDLHNAWCTHHHYLYSSRYNVGAACTGVGATLTCNGYRLPGLCQGPYAEATYYELMGSPLYFSGTLTDSCVQLIAHVETFEGYEVQAAVLVNF